MSEDLNSRLCALQDAAIAAIKAAEDLDQLESIRVEYLGKKGKLTNELKQLGKVPAEERPKIGQVVNVVKEAIATALKERSAELERLALEEKLK